MFSNLIIGWMELVHEEERVECKKISVGVYILKNTHEEGHVYLWKRKKKKKKISAYERRIDKRMMRMKGKEWGEEKQRKGMMRG